MIRSIGDSLSLFQQSCDRLCIRDGKPLRMTLNAIDNYNVEEDEPAISSGRLRTGGLYSCVGLSITQNEKNFLCHVSAGTHKVSLTWFISQNFDKSAPMEISLLNGLEPQYHDGYTEHASKICREALTGAGITCPVSYVTVIGGFMSEVVVDNKHNISFEGQLADRLQIAEKLLYLAAKQFYKIISAPLMLK